MTQRHTLTAPAGALLLLTGTGLAGCAVVNDLAHHFADHTYESAAAARDALGAGTEWIPDDAAGIRARTSTAKDAADAVVQLESAFALDPELCVAGARRSSPPWAFDDSPDPFTTTDAYVCGDWTVISAEGGWFGWTPNSAEERAVAAR